MNKKYFSKALLFAERKNIINSMIAYSFVLCFPLLSFGINLRSLRSDLSVEHNTTNLTSNIPYFLIVAICLATVIFSYNKKESRYSFMFTQPYSRDSILITRTIAYMVSYTLPIVLYGFISTILIAANKDVFGDNVYSLISSLNSELFILFVMLTLIVMLLQLMEMIFGKESAVVFFPLPIALISAFEFVSIYQITSTKIPYLKSILGHIIDSCGNFKNIMDKYLNGNSYSGLSIIFIIISAIILYICILLNRKIQIENMSGSFMFKFVENIVKFIFSMFIVAGLGMVVSVGVIIFSKIFNNNLFWKINQGPTENITQMDLLILDIVCTVLTVIVYKLLGKIASKRRLG